MTKKTTRITPLGQPMTIDPRLRTKEESQDIVGLSAYLPDRAAPRAPQPQGVERIATPRADGEASCSLCSEDYDASAADHDNDDYCPDCWADEPWKAPSERPSALDERGEA